MCSFSRGWCSVAATVVLVVGVAAGCPGESSGSEDLCPDDPEKIAPGECGCGVADDDTDGDGAADCVDGCVDDAGKREPGECGCGVADDDADGDGVADCVDGCVDDAGKTEPGDCGCGVADDDTDGDGAADCVDECADDAGKTEPGVCGCGVADDDADGDGVVRCLDVCEGFDDTVDSDGDGVPDGCDVDSAYCIDAVDCDDGLACTANDCVDNVCVTTSLSECAWPAEPVADAQNITEIEGPVWDNDMYRDLSGAVWDPVARTLWLCRNNGPSRIWAVVEDGAGGYVIDSKNGNRGEWSDFGDAEGLTLADLAEPETLYVLAEGEEHIREYDLSTYGTAVLMNDWNVQAHTPVSGGLGAEGITFVPDVFLAAQGFVDAGGAPYQSALGMGGLMLVGHQNGGGIFVFDLDRTSGAQVFVGEYETAATETAGLEFDRSTGLLYIWHGGGNNTVEVARLSSQTSGAVRRLDTVRVHTGPGTHVLGSDNYEGIAITSSLDCVNGFRRLFLTVDGGNAWSLFVHNEFPCGL